MTDSPTPQRPALLNVLSALTGEDLSPERVAIRAITLGGVHYRTPPRGMGVDSRAPWLFTGSDASREAIEALTTAGVLPESWAQDERRGFFGEVLCLLCKGRKKMVRPIMPSIDEQIAEMSQFTDSLRTFPTTLRTEVVDCEQCNGTGRVSGVSVCPVTIPDLVAWASLGRETITRAEALARETVVRLRPWGAGVRTDEHGVQRSTERVVWRVDVLSPAGEGLPRGWPAEADERESDGVRAIDEFNDEQDRWAQLIEDCGGEDCPSAWWRAHARSWEGNMPCPHECVADLHDLGLALDSITADAITLTVPPIGGVQ